MTNLVVEWGVLEHHVDVKISTKATSGEAQTLVFENRDINLRIR